MSQGSLMVPGQVMPRDGRQVQPLVQIIRRVWDDEAGLKQRQKISLWVRVQITMVLTKAQMQQQLSESLSTTQLRQGLNGQHRAQIELLGPWAKGLGSGGHRSTWSGPPRPISTLRHLTLPSLKLQNFKRELLSPFPIYSCRRFILIKFSFSRDEETIHALQGEASQQIASISTFQTIFFPHCTNYVVVEPSDSEGL